MNKQQPLLAELMAGPATVGELAARLARGFREVTESLQKLRDRGAVVPDGFGQGSRAGGPVPLKWRINATGKCPLCSGSHELAQCKRWRS
jgi:hypothetical protein